MDLNLHLVRYLVAVVDDGHFGRAAERLHVSAPALSQQVRKLEKSIGMPLLDRSVHPIRPTPVGERFLIEARAALGAADRAVATVAAFRRESERTVRVGFMTASSGPRGRALLDRFRREVPAANLQLVELSWADQVTAVRHGAVEAALVRPPFSDTCGLRFDLVWHEHRVVALSTDHRLASASGVLLDDLDDECHVSDDEADPVWVRWWANDPRPSGRPVRYGPSVRTIDELLETVASGAAIAITGAFVVEAHRHPGVVFVPLREAGPAQVSLCTRADDPSPLVGALRRAAADLAAKLEPVPRRDVSP